MTERRNTHRAALAVVCGAPDCRDAEGDIEPLLDLSDGDVCDLNFQK